MEPRGLHKKPFSVSRLCLSKTSSLNTLATAAFNPAYTTFTFSFELTRPTMQLLEPRASEPRLVRPDKCPVTL
eukprot:3934909-Rhodomonas_salina.6